MTWHWEQSLEAIARFQWKRGSKNPRESRKEMPAKKKLNRPVYTWNVKCNMLKIHSRVTWLMVCEVQKEGSIKCKKDQSCSKTRSGAPLFTHWKPAVWGVSFIQPKYKAISEETSPTICEETELDWSLLRDKTHSKVQETPEKILELSLQFIFCTS